MPKSNEEMKEWNKQAYGFEDMYGYKEQVLDAHKWDSPHNAYVSGAASVLSDAQHMLEFDEFISRERRERLQAELSSLILKRNNLNKVINERKADK